MAKKSDEPGPDLYAVYLLAAGGVDLRVCMNGVGTMEEMARGIPFMLAVCLGQATRRRKDEIRTRMSVEQSILEMSAASVVDIYKAFGEAGPAQGPIAKAPTKQKVKR